MSAVLISVADLEKTYLARGRTPVRALADLYTSSLVDQISRFDHDAVIRQAREYKF